MGYEATFSVACASARVAIYPDATFTGNPTSTKPVTLAGMVVADAETTNYPPRRGVGARGGLSG